LGGAIPPPQSRKAHISPESGTYQIRLAPPFTTVEDETQPARSVFAAACLVKRRRRVAVERAARVNILLFGFALISLFVYCRTVKAAKL